MTKERNKRTEVGNICIRIARWPERSSVAQQERKSTEITGTERTKE